MTGKCQCAQEVIALALDGSIELDYLLVSQDEKNQ